MEQSDSVPFSSVIAGLLLCRRNISAIEVVNFISRLNCEGIDVIDIDDKLEELWTCVNMEAYCNFSLKENLSYETILYENVTVRNFLETYVEERVFYMIQTDSVYSLEYEKVCLDCGTNNKIMNSSDLSVKNNIIKNAITVLKKCKKPIKRLSWYSFFEEIR